MTYILIIWMSTGWGFATSFNSFKACIHASKQMNSANMYIKSKCFSKGIIMPRMYDKRGRGDSGPVSMALRYTKKDGIEMVHDTRPLVGYAMRVGSLNARSYQSQDWWQTTPIEEIISETEDEVVFRTVNGSTYTWNV